MNIEEIVIAPNYIKKEILKKATQEKQIINKKILNKQEFLNNYLENPKKESLYFLMKKHNLKYASTQKYLKNILIKSEKILPFYEELKENNLLEENKLFKENIKKITVIDETLDPYILNDLKKYEINIIKNKKGNLTPNVHEFQSQKEELVFLAQDIIEKLKEIDINNIFISGITNDYKTELTRIFNLFKIPFNFNETKSIYSTAQIQNFIKTLKETKNIQTSLENIEESEIKNQIIDLLNNLYIPKIDETSIEIIINKLKTLKQKQKIVKNAVQIIDIDQINDKTKHYYILGLNQGIIPKIHKDDDLISDKEKQKLGILTSYQKNKIENEKIKYIIKSFPNITLSYKLKDTFNTYYPSFIINDLNLKIINEHNQAFTYSNDYNTLSLGIYLDNYFDYNEKNENLPILYNTYKNIEYKTYKNEYTNINKEDFKNYINSTLTLSYTALNNYALCPFKYYIKNILKLDPYEETFPILIGNLFHYCLSQMYNENFDLKTCYQTYLKDKNLNHKEKFYLKKLYNVLKQDIEIIKWQDEKSTYKNHLTEKYIEINKSNDIKIKFKGIIDKINYDEKNTIIIDYKTGTINQTLDNINYGLNMQLPTYLYLIKKGLGEKYQVNGFYLQKILTKTSTDITDPEKETKSNLKLIGYTINDENIIQNIDSTYENSEIISGMKKTQKGFYTYTKLIEKEQIDKLSNIVDENIEKAINNILNTNFKINPKRINNKNISCQNCTFKDLCFVKEENIKELKETKFKEIIEGDNNA